MQELVFSLMTTRRRALSPVATATPVIATGTKVPASEPAEAPRPTGAKRRKKAPWGARPQSRAEQRLIKEEVLFETAARWFGQHGYHGTSLTDLASELGITKANLYNYVQDKGELLYRLHLRSLEVAEVAHRAAVAEGRNGLERVRLIARNYVLAVTQSVAVTIIVLESGALPAEQEAEILARRRWLEHDLRQQIRDGISDGSIVPCDAKLMSLNIVGILYWTTTWYKPGGAWDGAQIAEATSLSVARALSSSPVELPASVSDFAPPAAAQPGRKRN